MVFSQGEVAELGLHQLSMAECGRAVEAFSGFAGVFGKEWLLAYFGGAQSARMVRAVVQMWDEWAALWPGGVGGCPSGHDCH